MTNNDDPNLRNLYWAMQRDPDNKPEVRVAARAGSNAPFHVLVDNTTQIPVTLGSNTITITGNVNVGTTVEVSNPPDNPVHAHIVEIGTSGNLQVGYMPIGGNVNATIVSIPEVEIKNDSGNPIPISANTSVNSVSNPIYVSGAGGSYNLSSFPDTAVTAFDEPMSVGITPILHGDSVYGLDPDFWNKSILSSGNVVTTGNSTWQVYSGTSAGGYARLATSRYMTYQPGQGSMFRWTAAFTTTGGTNKNALGIDNIVQTTGPIDREDGYAFGYSGSTVDDASRKLGILHRRGGRAEIRQLTVTVAPTGTQTAIITLNGVAYSITLTTSTSTEYTAAQIADLLKKDAVVSNTWDIEACGSTVTFIYYSPGPKTGTYSFSSSGAGTIAVASVSRLVAGISPTDVWTYVGSWDNQNIQFDPTKLNVYGIDLRWLGAGIVRFFMEDPSTGKMVLVHTQIWSSTNIVPHINKPSLRLVYRSGTTTGATPSQNVIVTGASVFAGIQGTVNQTGSSQGYYALNTSGIAKDTVAHLLSIQNPLIRNDTVNKTSLIMQDISVSIQGQDPAVIFLVKNAVGTSDLLVYNPLPINNAFVFAQYSISAVTENLSVDTLANIQALGINGNAVFNLIDYNLSLAPGDSISVFISSTNSISRAGIGITWKVD